MTETARQAAKCGALAARSGVRRSTNPHPVNSEEWSVWMDAFDTVTARRENGTETAGQPDGGDMP